jgi:hypothetical protein
MFCSGGMITVQTVRYFKLQIGIYMAKSCTGSILNTTIRQKNNDLDNCLRPMTDMQLTDSANFTIGWMAVAVMEAANFTCPEFSVETGVKH